MPDGAELHSPGGWFDEPDHGKECADRGGPGHGAGVIGFTDRRSSDIERQLDAVPAIGGQARKLYRAVQIQNWLFFLSTT